MTPIQKLREALAKPTTIRERADLYHLLPEILDRMEKLESMAYDAKVLAHAIAVTSSEGVDVKARAEIILEACDVLDREMEKVNRKIGSQNE